MFCNPFDSAQTSGHGLLDRFSCTGVPLKGATSSKPEIRCELKVATESVVGRFVMALESGVCPQILDS